MAAPGEKSVSDLTEDWSSLVRDDLAKLADIVMPAAEKTDQLMEGERREVAILFLDLQGFTAMSERLDHEVVHKITSGVMRALTRVVEGHGGYVDKYEGDLIMALFGAKHAAENDCARALACALRMQETLEEIAGMLAPRGIKLAARIGINTGRVTLAPDPSGHLTVTGDAVNLASRMESTAQVGTVQVTESVKEPCRDLFAWEDLGERRIKGKRKPVRTFRPLGPGAGQKARWERAGRVARSPLLGRDRELRLLRRAWSLRRGGAGRNRRGGARHIALTLRADAGIGKSRLCHEFLREELEKNADPPTILKGQTLSYAQPSFWLWITLLRDYFELRIGDERPGQKLEIGVEALLESLEDPSLKEALRRSLPFLAELLSIPHDDPRLEELDEKAKHQETLMALRNLIRALGSRREPPVLLLEDIHDLDPASREALEFVLHNCDIPRPLFVFLFQRPENEKERASPVFHKNYMEIRTIDLPPLDDVACRGIVRNMIAATYEVDAELAREYGEFTKIIVADESRRVEDFILKHTQGNPYFLEELVLEMIESGTLTMTEKGWALAGDPESLQVPASVAALAHSRMDRLGAIHRRALQRASVTGMEFALALYEKIADKLHLSETHSEVLRELVLRDFLRTRPGGDRKAGSESIYQFKHLVTRDTAYETLLHHNRSILHRFAAESLEELTPGGAGEISGIIADHWHEGGRRERAMEWGLRTLQRCRRRYLNDEGLAWVSRLKTWLDEMPQDESWEQRRFEVLESEEALLALMGKKLERKKALDEMLKLCEGASCRDRAGETQGRYGLYCREMGLVDEAMRYYRLALRSIEAGAEIGTQGIVLHNMGILCNDQGQKEEALRFGRMALAIHREFGNRSAEAKVLNSIGILFDDQGKTDEAREHYFQALEVHRKAGDRHAEGKVLNNLGGMHHELGRLAEAKKFYDQALAMHREIGDRRSEGIALANLAILHEDEGRPDQAMIHHKEALEINREIGNRRSEGIALGNLGVLFYEQGEMEEAIRRLEEALAIHKEVQDLEFLSFNLCMHAAALLADDRPKEAAESLRQAGEILDSQDYPKVKNTYCSVRGRVVLALSTASAGPEAEALGAGAKDAGSPEAEYHTARQLIETFSLGRDNALTRQFDKLRRELIDAGLAPSNLPLPSHWNGEEG